VAVHTTTATRPTTTTYYHYYICPTNNYYLVSYLLSYLLTPTTNNCSLTCTTVYCHFLLTIATTTKTKYLLSALQSIGSYCTVTQKHTHWVNAVAYVTSHVLLWRGQVTEVSTVTVASTGRHQNMFHSSCLTKQRFKVSLCCVQYLVTVELQCSV